MGKQNNNLKQLRIIRVNSGMPGAMSVVFDDRVNIKLKASESATVTFVLTKAECELRVSEYVFKIVDVKHVDKILLRCTWGGVIVCSVVYQDGREVELLNKNPAVSINSTMINIFFTIMMIVIFLPMLTDLLKLLLWELWD